MFSSSYSTVVVRLTRNEKVAGSIPAGSIRCPCIIYTWASSSRSYSTEVVRLTSNEKVAGSIPAGSMLARLAQLDSASDF